MKSKWMVALFFLMLVVVMPGHGETGDVHVFANFGVMGPDDFSFDPLLWYAGLNLDFFVGDIVMISPEVNLITYDFKFDAFLLEPAVMVNFRLGAFFLGGGVEKMFLITGDSGTPLDFGLKLNAGFRGDHVKMTFFSTMGFDSLFKNMLIGATLGIGF